MASLSGLISSPSPKTSTIYPKTSPKLKPLPTHISHHLRHRPLHITCSNSPDQDTNNNPTSRRDLLLTLGGAAAAAATFTVDPSFARPIKGPSVDTCVLATAKDSTFQCCPPSFAGLDIPDFQLPSASEPLRIRRPAHLAALDPEYVAKYEKAIKAMRCLPNDDPRSYVQQARVHCAYCNGSYVQDGSPDKGLQIHYSWLFLPFHRYYMYFYERILGKLIDDPTFALPFWNWDHEDGMAIADMFLKPESPLYDPLRNPNHVKPPYNLLDLSWSKVEVPTRTKEEQVRINYAVVYKNMVSGAKKRSEFFGAKYRSGSTVPERASSGSCENLHNPAHVWVGDSSRALGEDMGNFYSSGRDPLFYVHHGNVDRMWNVWKGIGKFRFDYDDYDFLNASFLFYDENAKPVRVKVKDCLDHKLMRYDYEDRPLPWRNFKTTSAKAETVATLFGGEKTANASPAEVDLTPLTEFPLTLDKVTSVAVARPKKSRSAAEKEAKSEVLVVYGIEVDGDKMTKFDVVVNDDPAAPSSPDKSEYAGSFLNVPHDAMKLSSNLRLDITELVDAIGADDDDELVVTLVPRITDGPISIAGVRIELQG